MRPYATDETASCERSPKNADSVTTRVGGQACPEHKAWPEQGRMGWLETECPEMHVQKPRRPVEDADAEEPRRGRSQSVRSSEEASNDRGAKGHRKLVGAMTVEGYMIQHSAPKAVRAGAAKAAGNRVATRGAAETRTQRKLCGWDGAVKRLQRPGQLTSLDQRLESRMPELGLSGLEGGARFKPSSLPLSQSLQSCGRIPHWSQDPLESSKKDYSLVVPLASRRSQEAERIRRVREPASWV
jgi:hypothetical protein